MGGVVAILVCRFFENFPHSPSAHNLYRSVRPHNEPRRTTDPVRVGRVTRKAFKVIPEVPSSRHTLSEVKDQSEARYGKTIGDVPMGRFDDPSGSRKLFDPFNARHLWPSAHCIFDRKKMKNPMAKMTATTRPMILNVIAEE